ncbi:MAG: hypothetical protein ABFC73_04985 [Clostridiaceae bacterium]
MKYFIRKFSLSRWNRYVISNQGVLDFKLNIFSRDLMAASNKLSLWLVEGASLEEVEQRASDFLLTMGLMGEAIDVTDIMFIPETSIADFPLEQSVGDAVTAVRGLEPFHYNIIDMDMRSLQRFLYVQFDLYRQFETAPRNDELYVKRAPERTIYELLEHAYQGGRIDFSKIKPKLQSSLNRKYPHLYPAPVCPIAGKTERLCEHFNLCDECSNHGSHSAS